MSLFKLFKLWKKRSRSFEDYVEYQIHRSELISAEIEGFVGNKKKLIDIGSHRGGYSIGFSKRNYKVFGLELDKSRINTASEMNARYKAGAIFARGAAEKAPFKNSCFDVAVSSNVIEHVTNPEAHLKECYRILKNGGVFYIQFPPYWGIFGGHISYRGIPLPLQYLPSAASSRIIKLLNCDSELHEIQKITIEKILKLANLAGFALLNISGLIVPRAIFKIPKFREISPFCNIILMKIM